MTDSRVQIGQRNDATQCHFNAVLYQSAEILRCVGQIAGEQTQQITNLRLKRKNNFIRLFIHISLN